MLARFRKRGLEVPEMIAVAVARGCRHYSNYARGAHIDASQFTDISDEELSVGLLHSSLPYNPAFIRIASQLLSGPNVDPEKLARVAVSEDCVCVLRYVVQCGESTEPGNHFWTQLLNTLPATSPPPEGVLPHISRFRSETGMSPRDRRSPSIEWLRPGPSGRSRLPSQSKLSGIPRSSRGLEDCNRGTPNLRPGLSRYVAQLLRGKEPREWL